MKFEEASPLNPHSNITSWVNAAKYQSVAEITSMLKDEAKEDTAWFLTGRRSRIKQLSSEIFTLKLMDVSNNKWSTHDFEGRDHSIVITSAINDVTNMVTAKYRELASAVNAQRVAK